MHSFFPTEIAFRRELGSADRIGAGPDRPPPALTLACLAPYAPAPPTNSRRALAQSRRRRRRGGGPARASHPLSRSLPGALSGSLPPSLTRPAAATCGVDTHRSAAAPPPTPHAAPTPDQSTQPRQDTARRQSRGRVSRPDATRTPHLKALLHTLDCRSSALFPSLQLQVLDAQSQPCLVLARQALGSQSQ
eukprot:3621841-Rhodomonas_salina.1